MKTNDKNREVIQIAKVILKENIKARIKNGHPWIYENEIEKVVGSYGNGDIVDVFYHSMDFLGKGYINDHSKIRVRLLTRKNLKIDKEFFVKKLTKILSLKRKFIKNTEGFRVVFSESDGLPGLIVDKFNDYLVIQIGSLGMERLKSTLISALVEVLSPKGIYEKSDYAAREREGLEKFRGWIYKNGPELIKFKMNGLTFYADTLGQKTGFFLDQRDNVKLIQDFVEDKEVLDVFSYTGNFANHSLKYGAKYVTLVDYSERALDIADMTLKENGFKGKYKLINANAFEFLRKLHKENEKLFDVIILDPPAFAKSFSDKKRAYRGYKEINLRAMKLLKENSTLITASCSRVVTEQDFLMVLYDAASDSKKKIQILRRGNQPPDHSPTLNIFETFYLKFFILNVENIKNS